MDKNLHNTLIAGTLLDPAQHVETRYELAIRTHHCVLAALRSPWVWIPLMILSGAAVAVAVGEIGCGK